MATGNVLRFTTERIERMEAERLSRISSRVSDCLSHLGRRRAFISNHPAIDGEYHWVREIAHGSFCSANLIRDKKSGLELVMKIAANERASADYPDPLGKCSLETEIRALTRIQNPHVPKVHAHNLEADRKAAGDLDRCELYCVMDFIEGETLQEADPKIGLSCLFQIAIQVSQAMEAAHIASVCHRDITEDNILVSFGADGAPFSTLIDFGLAKILPAGPSYPGQFGPTMIPYPSDRDPAAIRYDDMDERSDIYMLGLMIALNAGICRGAGRIDPERVSRKDPEFRIPGEAVQVIAKAMESEPDRRFQSAHEMRMGLERALHAIESEMTQLRG